MTIRNHLLAVPSSDSTFFASLDACIEEMTPSLRPVFQAFRSNLHAVSRIVTMPYRITHLSLLPELDRQIKDTLRAAVRRKGDAKTFTAAIAAKADALDQANADIRQRISEFPENAIARALDTLTDGELSLDVHELFTQSLVLSWGALEVLANDVFRAILDSKPHLSLLLQKHKSVRRLFGELRFDLTLLAAHQFNIASCIGALLLDVHRIDSIDTMKKVFCALFGRNQLLQSALCSSHLRLLNCRRHLIVHRRGVIDTKYIRDSRDSSQSLGSRLAVSLDDVNSAMATVRNFGVALLNAAAPLFNDDGS